MPSIDELARIIMAQGGSADSDMSFMNPGPKMVKPGMKTEEDLAEFNRRGGSMGPPAPSPPPTFPQSAQPPAQMMPDFYRQGDPRIGALESYKSRGGPGVPMPRPRLPDFDPSTGDEVWPPLGNLRKQDQLRKYEDIVEADDMLGDVQSAIPETKQYAAPGEETTQDEEDEMVIKQAHPFEGTTTPTDEDLRLVEKYPELEEQFIEEFKDPSESDDEAYERLMKKQPFQGNASRPNPQAPYNPYEGIEGIPKEGLSGMPKEQLDELRKFQQEERRRKMKPDERMMDEIGDAVGR